RRAEGLRHAQRSRAAARERAVPLRPLQLRGCRRSRSSKVGALYGCRDGRARPGRAETAAVYMEDPMRYLTVALVLFGALAIAAFAGQAPQNQQPSQQAPQQPAPNADPYANNAAPGATQFPLAAPAGRDSNARNVAPAGATNTGAFDPTTWKNGHAFDPPAGSKIW